MAREATKQGNITEDTVEETLNNSTSEDLQQQVEKLKEDIAAIASTLSQLGSQTVRDAKRTAKETYQNAFSQGEDVVCDLKEKAQDFEAQVTDTIREHPIASVATALGIGYLIALLSRR